MNQLAPSISVSPLFWTDTEGDGSRLLGTIVINGCDLHLEALAVTREGDMQIWTTDDNALSALHAAVGADRPWQTVTIDEREYVLIATPYCE